ncbi:disabled homolog 1-like isoform X2 [Ylistrum balloti]|uniref:disabled homolog 1-like isoform X2 n=1 Tax=Ylistrum balloti TaxID=509963 RepID=UPI002905ED5C|nr:disabled homolog 1-like isoform X2 [Ylistrum balloti]
MSGTTEPVPEAQPVSEVGSEPSSPSSTATSTTSSTPSTAPKQPQPVRKQVKKKDKNDPTRFQGEGVNFNAKLIGVDDVPDARGDRMCQETIYRLKLSVKASGQHKQRIIVNVSEEGIKLIDLKTAVVNYTHAVHKISFISRDVTDSRAFGYIFGVGDGTHKFFGIKTEKAAEALVLTLRDLFQVVYEKKKKEMEEAKQKAEEEEEQTKIDTKPADDPNVIKLGGELGAESSTDDEPVYQVPTNGAPIEDSPEHIYAVPSNNGEVKIDKSGNSLVELETELETIGQGIEQMNKFETDFDALAAGTPSAVSPAASTGSDPWGTGSTSQADQKSADNSLFDNDFGSTTNGSAQSGQSDLQDIDLFGTQPVIKGKDDIMNLFGPQNSQMPGGFPPQNPQIPGGFPPQNPQIPGGFPPQNPQMPGGFGPSVSPVPQAFGVSTGLQPAAFPGAPVAGVPPQPGMPNPFGGPPAFGTPQENSTVTIVDRNAEEFSPPPPVPQRPSAAPAPAINPFGEDPFANAAPTGGFANFSNGNTAGGALFDEPLLAPVKLTVEEAPQVENKAGTGDAFSDLCELGTKDKTALSPKGLFAELSAQPKKSINQLRTEQVPKGPQASDSDPFGSVDNASLPAVVNFSSPFQTKTSDPFDTSHIKPAISSQSKPESFHNVPCSSKSKFKDLAFSENDDFNLPSPEGPPPPLPSMATPRDMPQIIPPAPPPRPSGSPAANSTHSTLPQPDSPPRLPPRNSVSNLQHTPVPRPRPRPKVNSVNNSPPLPPRNKTISTKDSNGQESHIAKNNVDKESHGNGSTSSDNVIKNVPVVDRFVIEDPFLNSDPFAETDVFSSSSFDGFPSSLSIDDFNSNDPFMSSQQNTNNNRDKYLDSKDDPFAVFDNCLNDTFNFKSGNSRKNSKKKRNSTGN